MLAEIVNLRKEIAPIAKDLLIVAQWEAPEVRIDDFTGMTTEEARKLASLNTYFDGKAVIGLAGGNLSVQSDQDKAKDKAKKQYLEFIAETHKREMAGSDNFDKQVLTLSSAGLGLSESPRVSWRPVG